MAKLQNFPEPPRVNQMVVDSESDHENGLARPAGSGRNLGTVVIHSGHFMVSSPHSDPVGGAGGDTRYDFDTVNRPRCQTYSFGPFSSRRLSIDPTLTRLFECMTLAYRYHIHVFPHHPKINNKYTLTMQTTANCT